MDECDEPLNNSAVVRTLRMLEEWCPLPRAAEGADSIVHRAN